MKRILFLLVKLGAVLSEIVVPRNTAVLAGDKMNMNCTTTNNSAVRKWTVYTPDRTTSTILQGSPWRLRGEFVHFSVDTNANGPAIISTNSTRLNDAGYYTCHCENDGKDTEYRAHLIVLESLPVCESNLTRNNSHSLTEDDHIWIQCNVKFGGFWAPSMEWIQHGGGFGSEGMPVTDGIETTISPNQGVTSRLTIAVNPTHGFYYSCKIYFARYNGTLLTTAKNVPSFTYTWNSSLIFITHSSTQSFFAVSSSPTETSSAWWITIIVVLSICVGIVIISVCIVNRRKLIGLSGSTEKAKATAADSDPEDYINMTTEANATVNESQAATYMELTSSNQASPSVYASINIAEKMIAMPKTTSPVYENMADL